MSVGAKFRQALSTEQPLQIAGAMNALSAMLAEQAGFQALYLSGAGVANASYGIPDIGATTLDQVLIDVGRICQATDLPLLVDCDTGWDEIPRTVSAMIEAGAAGMHIEDQVVQKRCGHLEGKQLVSLKDMLERIKEAVAAKTDKDFIVMARTDAYGVEGLSEAIERAKAYVVTGAEMIFAEAMSTIDDYKAFTAAVEAPVLANMTEFGKTPLFGLEDLREAGVAMALYPLSAFRAMNKAAKNIYDEIRQQGTQQQVVDQMQTREALYELLNYKI